MWVWQEQEGADNVKGQGEREGNGDMCVYVGVYMREFDECKKNKYAKTKQASVNRIIQYVMGK